MSAYLINQNTLNGFEDISQNVDPKRILVFVKKAQDLDLRLFLGDAFYYDFIQYCSNVNGVNAAVISTRTTTAANGAHTNAAITATSGTGTSATANVSVFGGSVSNISINQHGLNFAVGDTFTVAGITGTVFSVSELSTELSTSGMPQPYLDLFNGKSYTDLNGHTIIYDGITPALVYWTFARFIEADSVRYTATGPVTKKHDDADAVSQKDIAALVTQQRSVANAKCNDIEKFLWNNKTVYPLWRYNERNKNSRQPGARITAIDRTSNNRAGYGSYNNGIDGYGGMIDGY